MHWVDELSICLVTKALLKNSKGEFYVLVAKPQCGALETFGSQKLFQMELKWRSAEIKLIKSIDVFPNFRRIVSWFRQSIQHKLKEQIMTGWKMQFPKWKTASERINTSKNLKFHLLLGLVRDKLNLITRLGTKKKSLRDRKVQIRAAYNRKQNAWK